jgi:hypothetical protein
MVYSLNGKLTSLLTLMATITPSDVFQPIEIIEGRLNFCPQETEPSSTEDHCYYTIDHDPAFRYKWICKSTGPPTLSQIHRFYRITCEILKTHSEQITFYCFDNAYRFTSAVSLLCTFQMLHLHRSAEESFKPFVTLAPCLIPFVGGWDNIATHPLSVLAMLKGFEKALSLNWYIPDQFNAEGWDYTPRRSMAI